MAHVQKLHKQTKFQNKALFVRYHPLQISQTASTVRRSVPSACTTRCWLIKRGSVCIVVRGSGVVRREHVYAYLLTASTVPVSEVKTR